MMYLAMDGHPSFHHFFPLMAFMPHGYCFNWLPTLVFLHVFSDTLIGCSYMLIPLGLAYIVHRRKDLPFGWIFFCFCVFIFSCGTTHFMEVWTLWHANYWVSGLIKLFTGIISFATALLLFKLAPKILQLPSPAMLREANQLLKKEIKNRKYKELELQKSNIQLGLALESIKTAQDEMRIQNEKLQEVSHLKSAFLANMSHELRTPLNGIIGFSEMLLSGKVGPLAAEHQEYLDDVFSSAKHLLHLINDLLDLSKIEAGTMEFYPRPVDLSLLVAETQNLLRSVIEDKKIKFKVHLDPSLKNIVIDPDKLKQILYNYLSNALKFTAEKGQVTLNIYPDKTGYFRVEVNDNGIGIKNEDKGKLFIAFQQLNCSSSKKYPGTGLGLSLVKRIVEAQGGQVGFDSVIDQGSTFYAILPLHASQKPT